MAKNEVIRDCTHAFQAQWGLPCWHKIIELLVTNQPLELRHIDPHWYLKRRREEVSVHDAKYDNSIVRELIDIR